MSESNLSCLLYGAHDARFEERDIPQIQDPYDVIVKIAFTGVCGSDVSFLLFLFSYAQDHCEGDRWMVRVVDYVISCRRWYQEVLFDLEHGNKRR